MLVGRLSYSSTLKETNFPSEIYVVILFLKIIDEYMYKEQEEKVAS